MLIPLQLQIVFNPTQPRREVFTSGPISFGRDTANRIVLPEAVISRKHGRIELVDDKWVLFNESDNGTEVNGKSVGKKGRVLSSKDVVSVGDRRLFEVILDAPAGATDPSQPLTPEREAANDPGAKKRRLLKYVGVILGVYFVVGAFFLTLDAGSKNPDGPVTALTAETIKADILRPRKPVTPDTRKSSDCLDAANEFYAHRETDIANTYRAFENYRLALAYLNKTSFEDDQLSQLRFLEVQDALIKNVTTYYQRGHTQFKSKQYEEAEATFSKLRRDIYPDVESKIAKNVDEQRVKIGPFLKRKRR